jgi:hypothetical protein
MTTNEVQLERLQGNAALIIENPIPSMIALWMEWANANIEQIDDRHVPRRPLTHRETILPVLWCLSQLHAMPPRSLFHLMRHQLVMMKRRQNFHAGNPLRFRDAQLALKHVLGRIPSNNHYQVRTV